MIESFKQMLTEIGMTEADWKKNIVLNLNFD